MYFVLLEWYFAVLQKYFVRYVGSRLLLGAANLLISAAFGSIAEIGTTSTQLQVNMYKTCAR